MHISIICIYVILLIHSTVNGHLGCSDSGRYYEQYCYEQSYIRFCVNIYFQFSWIYAQEWNCLVIR